MTEETGFTHLDAEGRARMVDVGAKQRTERRAVAEGRVAMMPETRAAIREGRTKKGAVLGTARLAGIMAAKKKPAAPAMVLARWTGSMAADASGAPALSRMTRRTTTYGLSSQADLVATGITATPEGSRCNGKFFRPQHYQSNHCYQ